MPNPLGSDLHIDWFLSGILIAYMNKKEAYIADRLFPIMEVSRRSNKIAAYTKADWFRNEAKFRSPGTKVEVTGFGTARHQYYCENYATGVIITPEDRAMQDDPYDIDSASTMLVGHRLMMRREISWATDFFKHSVWDASRPGGVAETAFPAADKWSTYSSSDPIDDVFKGIDAIHSTTAQEATDLTIGRYVWTALRNHPDFIDRIKYTQTAVVTMDLVARLINIANIRVGNALYVTSNEGAASDAFSYVFGKHALLTHTARNPGILMPTSGVTLTWSPLQIGGRRGQSGFPTNGYVRYLFLEEEIADKVEGHTFYDQLAIGKDLGYFMRGVVE